MNCVVGKLLRETEPELMDTLIQATKVGDQKTLQALAGPKTAVVEEKEEEEDDDDEEDDDRSFINCCKIRLEMIFEQPFSVGLFSSNLCEELLLFYLHSFLQFH